MATRLFLLSAEGGVSTVYVWPSGGYSETRYKKLFTRVDRITCERSESARERRIAIYKSNQQSTKNKATYIIGPLGQTQRPSVDKEFQRGVPQVVKPVGSESAQVADASRCQVQFQNFATRSLGQPLQHVRVADVMEPVTEDTPASGLEPQNTSQSVSKMIILILTPSLPQPVKFPG